MADNTTLNSGSGGNVIRTLEDGSSVHWPVTVLAHATSVGTPDVLTVPTAAALADGTSNPTLPLGASCLLVFNGTTWDRLRGDTNGLNISDISAGTQTNDVKVTLDGETVTLAANSGVDIGDVDVTSIIPGTSATNLGKTVDAASGGTDTGVASLAIRDDSLSTLTPVEGDYVRLRVDANGALWAAINNTVTVTDDGSFALAANDGVDIGDVTINNASIAVTSASALDVSAATVTVANTNIDNLNSSDFDTGAGTDTTPSIGIAVPASGGAAVVTGDTSNGLDVDVTRVQGTVTVTDDGSFTLAANSGVDIGDVDVTSVTPGTGASNLGKAEDAAHTTGDVGVMALSVRNDTLAALAGTDGDYTPLQVNASGALYIQEGSALNVSGATVTVTDNGSFTLAANSGVDIGDVDVTSVTPGTGASNLGKAEDAAHTTGDVGVMALGIRKDSGASIAGTDGDYTPFQLDSSGNLRVNVAAGSASGTEFNEDDAHTTGDAGTLMLGVRNDSGGSPVSTDGDYQALQFDSSGNLRVTGSSGGTSSVDDAAFTVATDSGTPMMGVVTADAVDSGDVGVVGMDTSRNLKVSIEVDNVGIGGGTQYTEDDATPANPTGTAFLAERDDALGGLTPIEGDWTHLYCDANGALWTAVNNTVTVTDDGSFTLAANSGVDIGDVDVTSVTPGTGASNLGKAEDAAHTTGDVGVMALSVRNDTLAALATTDGDYAPLQVNASGALYIQEGSALDVSGATVTVTDDGSFTLAANDGVDIGDVTINNASIAVTSASALDVSAATVTVANTNIDNLNSSDFDTGAGTDTTPSIGIAVPASGGAAVVTGDTSNGLDVDVTRVQGTVTVTDDGSFTLAANSGVDIGDVDVTSVTPGTGANNLGKAEDAAHTTGDVGVMALSVRNDTLAALATTDGDYAPLQVNASGALYIQEGSALDVSAATVTVSATQLDVDDLVPTSDNVGAAHDTSQIMDGTTSLTPKYAAISASTSGDNTIVSAVVGKKIRVLSVFLIASAAVTARFEDGAAGTALTGQMQLAANGGFVLPFNPVGWFETTANTLLNLELSGAISTDGSIQYVEV